MSRLEESFSAVRLKEEEPKEKKGGGFWFDFMRQAGLGSSRGAAGGFGQSMLSGGLLATKAGVVAVILVSTTVAGVSYTYFSRGPANDTAFEDSFNSIFPSRPKPAAGDDGEAKASAQDGSSASLQYAAEANKGAAAEAQSKPEEPAAAAPDALKDAVASPLPAAPAAAVMANNNTPAAGAAAKLGGVNVKLGELTKSVGGGHSGAAYNPGPAAAVGGASAGGQLGKMRAGFSGGAGGSASTASGRAIATPSRLGKNFRTLGAVMRDQRGATSSAAAGHTYDRGPTQSSTFGPEQSLAITGAGSGAAGKAAAANNINPATNPSRADLSVPPVEPRNVTPWQGALDTAKYLLMGALALMFIGKMCIEKALAARAATPYAEAAVTGWKLAAQIALGLAAAAGLAAMAIGVNIATGPNNQPLQGWALALGGGCAAAAALVVLKDIWNMDCGATAAETKLGPLLGGNEVLMYVGGGAALLGLAVTYLTTPKTMKDDGKNHDWGAVQPVHSAPSARALDRFIA